MENLDSAQHDAHNPNTATNEMPLSEAVVNEQTSEASETANNKYATRRYALSFTGKGSEYFKIAIINWILIAITLGFYYPWAKAERLKYLYRNTYLENDNFTFSGTGKEMFIGFIKGLLLIGLLYGLMLLCIYYQIPLALLVVYLLFFFLVPLAIHGSLRYRSSRSSWRGIRFGYTGNRGTLVGLFIKGILLTIITFGIYGFWFYADLRNYVTNNLCFGNSRGEGNYSGGDWLIINLKGYILTVLTFGIYSFWWLAERFEYSVSNTDLVSGDKRINACSTATGGDFFNLLIVNFFMLIFTFGLAYPWVLERNYKFYTKHVVMEGNIDLDKLQQTQEQYRDAFGEDIGDFLDLDISF